MDSLGVLSHNSSVPSLAEDPETAIRIHEALERFDARWKQRQVPCDMTELQAALGFAPAGIDAMFNVYPEVCEIFFSETLPFIVQRAGELEALTAPSHAFTKLSQGSRASMRMPRQTVLSLLAHMFLCTTDALSRGPVLPDVSFAQLLSSRCSAEVAKLRMFVEYFNKVKDEGVAYLQGDLRIHRLVRERRTTKDLRDSWLGSHQPLLKMEVEEPQIGFEDHRGRSCLHADFANMMLGGGVLSGGSVQEEIRFATCPELVAAMLVCPFMLEHEAIHVVGAEQFSEYIGYAGSLSFAGRHNDAHMERDLDGTPLIAITAMDALDFRYADNALKVQMHIKHMLREVEKAAAAFTPPESGSEEATVATGNWGCGIFRGFAPLKAVLQWLAASEVGRHLRYFPYNEPIGGDLSKFSKRLAEEGVTVGKLFASLLSLAPSIATASEAVQEHFLELLERRVFGEELPLLENEVSSVDDDDDAWAEEKSIPPPMGTMSTIFPPSANFTMPPTPTFALPPTTTFTLPAAPPTNTSVAVPMVPPTATFTLPVAPPIGTYMLPCDRPRSFAKELSNGGQPVTA